MRTDRFGPLTAGMLFERTAELLRQNGRLFFGIGLLVVAAELVGGGVLGATGIWLNRLNPNASPAAKALFFLPLWLLCFSAIYVVAQIAQGAFFFGVRARLEGAAISVGEACAAASGRLGTLIAVSLLVALRILGYLLLFYIAAAIVVGLLGLAFGGMRLIAAFGPGHGPMAGIAIAAVLLVLVLLALYLLLLFWLILRYSIAVPAALAENLRASEAIRRSIELTRGAKGRLIALFAAVGALWLLVMVVTLPVQIMAARGMPHPRGAAPAAFLGLMLAIAGARLLVSWLLSIFLAIALVLCYYDLRVRKSGSSPAPLDLQRTAIRPAPQDGPELPELPVEDLPIS